MIHKKFRAWAVSGTSKFKADGELHLENDAADLVVEVIALCRNTFNDQNARVLRIKFFPIKAKGS